MQLLAGATLLACFVAVLAAVARVRGVFGEHDPHFVREAAGRSRRALLLATFLLAAVLPFIWCVGLLVLFVAGDEGSVLLRAMKTLLLAVPTGLVASLLGVRAWQEIASPRLRAGERAAFMRPGRDG